MEQRFKETISRTECEAIAIELEKLSTQMSDEDSNSSIYWAWSLDRIVCSLRGLFAEEEKLSAIQADYKREVDAAIEEYQTITSKARQERDDATYEPNRRYSAIYDEAHKKCDERIKQAEKILKKAEL